MSAMAAASGRATKAPRRGVTTKPSVCTTRSASRTGFRDAEILGQAILGQSFPRGVITINDALTQRYQHLVAQR
jgi:hypothetical protein